MQIEEANKLQEALRIIREVKQSTYSSRKPELAYAVQAADLAVQDALKEYTEFWVEPPSTKPGISYPALQRVIEQVVAYRDKHVDELGNADVDVFHMLNRDIAKLRSFQSLIFKSQSSASIGAYELSDVTVRLLRDAAV